MKYTIHVNQAGADAAGLRGKVDIIDLAIFDAFKDFANGTKCEKKVGSDGRIWFWVSYSLIISEIPYCNITTNDGIYRRMKNLAAAGVIEFHPDNQRTNKTFFTWGPVYDTLISTKPTDEKPEVITGNLRMKNRTPTDEKPEGYGLKTGGGTDEKPDDHNTNNPFTNPHTKNQNNAGENPLTPPFKKITIIDPETPDFKVVDLYPLEAEKKKQPSPGRGAAKRGPQIHPENETAFQHFNDPEKARAAWAEWLQYKYDQHRERYKNAKSELVKLRSLWEETKGDAVAVERNISHSIGNLYRGIFPPKTEKNGNGQHHNGTNKATAQHLDIANYIIQRRQAAMERRAMQQPMAGAPTDWEV